MTTQRINILDIQVGNIVHFYGARFEITSRKEYKETREDFIARGCNLTVGAKGKWLDGKIENNYFGPDKDWWFQGNKGVTHTIEV